MPKKSHAFGENGAFQECSRPIVFAQRSKLRLVTLIRALSLKLSQLTPAQSDGDQNIQVGEVLPLNLKKRQFIIKKAKTGLLLFFVADEKPGTSVSYIKK